MKNKVKSQRKHITTAMIIASSNILRKGVHIIVDRASSNKLIPVYSDERSK